MRATGLFTTLLSILSLTCFLHAQQGDIRSRDENAIQTAKDSNVHRMEPALPSQSFVTWLRAAVGPEAKFHWEVNDCGEQTGDPRLDQGRDFPLCAEVQVSLRGRRKLLIALSVGTFKKGIRAGPASFASAMIVKPDGSILWIKKLSATPAAIKALD